MEKRMRPGPIIVTIFAALSGCKSVPECEFLAGEGVGDLRKMSCINTISDEGLLLKIPIQPGDGAFLVHAKGTDDLAVEYVEGPEHNILVEAEEWYQSEFRYSNGLLPFAPETTFNYPVQKDDVQLQEGDYWVQLLAIDNEGYQIGDVPVDVTVHINEDNQFDAGAVRLRVLYTQEAAQSTEIQTAIEAALEQSNTILSPFGMSATVKESFTGDLDEVLYLPNPMQDEDDTYLGLQDMVDPGELLIVIGDEIGSSEEANAIHGVSGGIPGTLTESNRGLVVISWLTHAGSDAKFNSAEINLMGETLAHELCHYLGLYHPMDDSEGVMSTFDLFDNLQDTEACTTSENCETVLGSNLMFPYTLCQGGTCDPQDQLTPQQTAVTQRYTGVQ